MIGYTVPNGQGSPLAVRSRGHTGSTDMISGRALERVGRWRASPNGGATPSPTVDRFDDLRSFRTNPAAPESKPTQRSRRTQWNQTNPAERANAVGPKSARSERTRVGWTQTNPPRASKRTRGTDDFAVRTVPPVGRSKRTRDLFGAAGSRHLWRDPGGSAGDGCGRDTGLHRVPARGRRAGSRERSGVRTLD